MAKLRRAPTSPQEATARKLAELEKRLKNYERLTTEAWHNIGDPGEPAFEAGWSTSNGSAGFLKDPDGFVWLRAAAAGGAGNIFLLPAGYRPSENTDFAVAAWNGAAFAFGVVRVNTTGFVSSQAGPTNIVPFGTVRFRAAA